MAKGAYKYVHESDGVSESGRHRLLRIADELREMAGQYPAEHLTPAHVPDIGVHELQTRPRARDSRMLGIIARTLYACRRMRSKLLGDDEIFGEPAWDILLDLYTAHSEGKLLPVTSACIGASVPVTTALRWLNILESRNLIVRELDPNDARRTYVRISDEGITRMERLLGEFDRLMGHPSPAG